jgi:hypothetical protein
MLISKNESLLPIKSWIRDKLVIELLLYGNIDRSKSGGINGIMGFIRFCRNCSRNPLYAEVRMPYLRGAYIIFTFRFIFAMMVRNF